MEEVSKILGELDCPSKNVDCFNPKRLIDDHNECDKNVRKISSRYEMFLILERNMIFLLCCILHVTGGLG